MSMKAKKAELSSEQKELFQEVKTLYNLLLKSSLFQAAYQRVLTQSNNEFRENFPDILNSLEKVTSKVCFVEDAKFWSMIGFDVIFLNKDLIFALKSKNEQKARCIGLLIHEGWHYVFRDLLDNFAINANKREEGGFGLEKEIWGTLDIMYWDERHCQKVLEISNWDSKGSLFQENELENRQKRDVSCVICSGLCLQ